MTDKLLEVDSLSVSFDTDNGRLTAVDYVSFSIYPSETVGLVGESGCGKSVTAHSIMRLLPQPMGSITNGSVDFKGINLASLSLAEMEKVRGSEIGMVFQEPMTALNPVQTIGKQVSEALILHRNLTVQQALQATVEILQRVGVSSPEVRASEYPHQLSGGMRQRVVIAIALACKPSLLIADEPTTALDVTIQAQILNLISDLQKEMKMAVLLITHDLGIIAETCDRVLVMYAGNIVESGTVYEIFDQPAHPYTQGLLNSIPRLETLSKSTLPVISGQVPVISNYPVGCRFENRCPHSLPKCSESVPESESISQTQQVSCFAWRDIQMTKVKLMPTPLLEVQNLKKFFPVREGLLMRAKHFNQAVNDVSLTIQPGETLGLVGESGCGKSTLGRCIVNLYKPDQGQIQFEGVNIKGQTRAENTQYRRSVQMIFQDPLESLNSRHTVEEILTEPLLIHNIGDRKWRQKRVTELLDIVGLPSAATSRYPFEFSGGQRQRVGIARAIALEPKLIVCDEAVSALDVSIQSQIINLLLELQAEFKMAYLFIAHDLAVVKHISDRVAVMYLGKIVETANSETIYKNPKHPYTQSLIDSIPIPDPHHKIDRQILQGDIPSSISPPSGCGFHTRCPRVMEHCQFDEPRLRDETLQHSYRCHLD